MDAIGKVYGFYERYAGEKCIYGQSVCGQPLVALHSGGLGYPQILLQYSIHAREWITSLLALEQIAEGAAEGGAWFLPLTNPDGAALSIRGADFLQGLPGERAQRLIEINGGEDFSLWKANANAVDLNVNFAADWGKGVKNVTVPGSENYIGTKPFSEPETRALAKFTRKVRPDATVSYHTKGAEIYAFYGQKGRQRQRSERLAAALSRETGYRVAETFGSCGGYKDWCIKALNIPSFTIEAGSDEYAHPLTERALSALVRENKGVAVRLAKELFNGR